jgi:ribosomal-protein-alanine acetyltransferase
LGIHSPVTIRAATSQDIPDMIRLEGQSPTAAHWTEGEYRRMFEMSAPPATRIFLVAEREPRIDSRDEISPVLGFLVASQIAPEWELENIVIASEARAKGIGTRLMQELLARANQTHSEAVFLEVRESNVAARALYAKLDFRETGRRKSYYVNPIEDAILYSKSLHQS